MNLSKGERNFHLTIEHKMLASHCDHCSSCPTLVLPFMSVELFGLMKVFSEQHVFTSRRLL